MSMKAWLQSACGCSSCRCVQASWSTESAFSEAPRWWAQAAKPAQAAVQGFGWPAFTGWWLPCLYCFGLSQLVSPAGTFFFFICTVILTGTAIFSKVLLKDIFEKYVGPNNTQVWGKRDYDFEELWSGAKGKEWDKKDTTSFLLTANHWILHPFSRWRKEIGSFHIIGSF